MQLNTAYLEWKYSHNPYTPGPLIYVAMHGSRLVGMRVNRVGVVGAGVIGTSTAWDLAQTGHEVLQLVVTRIGEKGALVGLLVKRDTPGHTIIPMRGLLGLRASMLGKLCVDRCRLPGDARVGSA